MDELPEGPSPLLDALHAQLMGAIELLNAAASSIKESELDHGTNIRRIGEALAQISAIADDLYEIEPQLVPLFLRNTKRWKSHFE
jgi:hypothetical protein